ncbi:transferrin-binding protein-like solute binding protein [Dichelobacter nodosus]|uniref:Outer membrane protein 1D n=1 Tax=Dichelobacter nodosus (strain VCS1703A) TaxID=246195 RepID=A5EVZ1_DICNV|nr:transferrin-binding protein-like solute binding protein [Dichelobacter nodosus]ABQ13575.1 outer membrane protein 1D [Dichelobacter nodosus VCS1703A]
MKLSHLSLAIISAITLAACGGGNDDKPMPQDPDNGALVEQRNEAIKKKATAYLEDKDGKAPALTKDEEATLSQIAPELAAKYKEEKEKRGANPDADKVVDPTQTGVVDGFDFKKQSSYGVGQYLRGAKSDFDTQYNPVSEHNSAPTSVTGEGLDEQNPELTNIFFAKKTDKKTGKLIATQFVGIKPTDTVGDITNKDSLQQQNKHNVALDSILLSYTGNENPELQANGVNNKTKNFWGAGNGNAAAKIVKAENIENEIEAIKAILEKFDGLDDAAKADKTALKNKAILEKTLADLQAIQKNEKQYERTDLLVLDKYSPLIPWGDFIKTDDTLTQKDADTTVDVDSAKSAGAPGLIAVNFAKETRAETAVGEIKKTDPKFKGEVGAIQGTEENSYSSTRIFGKNFSPDGLKDIANSYKGATTIVSAASLPKAGGATDTGLTKFDATKGNLTGVNDATTFNAHVAGADIQNTIRHSLAAETMFLDHVQYGRVTGLIEAKELEAAKPEEAVTHIQDAYTTRNDDKAVNQYFYRGTGATTLEQMAALPKDKELHYQGHALMYGIDNSFHGGKDNSLPYAFGAGSNTAIGNFVDAKVDLNKGEVVGYVYNVWQKGETSELISDKLVDFKGNVHGNTVIGGAKRTYVSTDKQNPADFRASFFGEQAGEMGGSFNSNLAKDGYTHEGDVWGGVFGAQRTVEPVKKESEYDTGWLISHGK